jgi:hypothetical protein
MTCGTVGGHALGLMTIDAERHLDLDQGALGRYVRVGDSVVTVDALELGDAHVAAVRVEDVVRKSEQLLESQLVSARQQLGDLRCFGRLSQRRSMAESAGLGAREARMPAGLDILVAELTPESELLRVLAVVERNRLRDGRVTARLDTPHVRHQEHSDQQRRQDGERNSADRTYHPGES